jgi:AraC family transcriptional regulator
MSGANAGPNGQKNGKQSSPGLRVDRHTTRPGVVELRASSDHRLKMLAGDPVRGACQSQRFLYTRGDMDLVPAGASDIWEEDDANTSVVLQFSPLLLRHAAEELGLDSDRAGIEPRHQFRDSQMEHIAWALDAEHHAGSPNGRLYTDSLALALSIHLLGRYAAPLSVQRGLSGPQLRRVTEYVEEHLDQDLSLAQLAAVAGVSVSHFKTLFRRSTGQPVHEFVVQRRVARARTLLLGGDMPASQVALEAGFAHQSHMARWMRRVLGVTPAALQKDRPAT